MKTVTVFETAAEFFDALYAQSGEKCALLPDSTGLHFHSTESVIDITNAGEFELAPNVRQKDVVAEALRRLGVNATFE